MPLRTAGCTASRHARLERPPERHVGGCTGAWAQSSRLPRQVPCRCCYLVGSGGLSLTGPRGTLVGIPGKLLLPGPCCLAGARGASRQVPWYALSGLPSKLLLPGSCLFSLYTCSWMAPREPWRVLAFARQALPRGAATTRAQVRGTRVPLF